MPIYHQQEQNEQQETQQQQSNTPIVDNRPEAQLGRELQEKANNSSQAQEGAHLKASAQEKADKEGPKKKVNKTGIPDRLKAVVEHFSGLSLDEVRVHYNSDKPALVNAHAYAEGLNIYIGPGQETHLAHEVWHVVQQMKGKVKTNKTVNGTPVNDAPNLEKEAETKGKQSLQQTIPLDSAPSKTTLKKPTSTPVAQRHTIMQPGYATGDMFGIVATLLDDDKAHVVISGGKGPLYDTTDKGNSIEKFYRDSGVPSDRIHRVYVDDIRKAGKDLRTEAMTIEQHILNNVKSKKKIKTEDIKSISGGTEYIAAHFSEDTRDKLKTAWDVNDSKDTEIKEWLQQKGIPTGGNSVAVLWSRFSGKKGDIHLEHDSSYTGIEQIAVEAAKKYKAVIIAGDKGYKAENGAKYDTITDRINAKLGEGKVFNLTEFWSEGSETLKAWGGDTRFGQFKLYDYLHRQFAEAKHLGFRSGNLEALAMLGYEVRYMEEPDSIGGDRMEKWHKQEGGLTEGGGLATGYERLMVSAPPTRSGKYLKEHPEIEKRPTWAPGRDTPTKKPEEIAKYSKGFADHDLVTIMEFLTPKVTERAIIPLQPALQPQINQLQIMLAIGNALDFMGLPREFSSLSAVSTTYRKLAVQYHPDKDGDKDKFNLLSQARAILNGDFSSINTFNNHPKLLTYKEED